MSDDRMDVVIVGGGMAGLAAAYRLCQAGRMVILLERGDSPGSKNVTGGRIYVEPLAAYLPDLLDKAPFERHVVKEVITIMDEGRSVQIEHLNEKWRKAPYPSYTVLRAKFDNWLAEKVMEQGGFVIPRRRVDDLLWEDGRVAGVRAGGEEIPAHIVIAADGALSFMAEKANLRPPLIPSNYAVAAKEIYKLDEKIIEERFGLDADEGVANLFAGSLTKGMFGGGFLYTNKDTISVGLVVGIDALSKNTSGDEMHGLMNDFVGRPEVQHWVRGSELEEYSAHIISEAGLGGLSKLYAGGMLVAGDAAGMALNMGITVRGMDFALASGVIAADVADQALGKKDCSETFLSMYEKKLKESFILRNMETYHHSKEVLKNKRLFNVYPKFLCELFEELFTIGDGTKVPLYKTAMAAARKYMLNMQGLQDFMSLRKI